MSESKKSEQCNHECSSCGVTCSERTEPEIKKDTMHEMSSVKRIIGVVSGKGGVGKSLVTSIMAVAMGRTGAQVGIMDADITGPSIPKIFGIRDKVESSPGGLWPIKTESGIDVMSINLLLEKETDPVLWRGPIIAGVVKQFWTDVIWANEDYLFIDMPPGTGDVPLTVYQSIPIDGIIIVTSPQALVAMVVEKSVNMAKIMNVPVIGIVENMAYFTCPDCGSDHEIYGKSHVENIAQHHRIKVLGRIPLDPRIAEACDDGLVESLNGIWMDELAENLKKRLKEIDETTSYRIAAAMDEEALAVFGGASAFRIYDIENELIVSSNLVDPSGRNTYEVADFLIKAGVSVLLCQSATEDEIKMLEDGGIKVVKGVEGGADVLVEDFLANKIQ
ncbi:MAG: P-loop NTPase [Anaerovoracaceae bacterium]|jgi:Mrp family chromosome partitioning ATPase/predicted Fe-Mo cluster-binding NifX family protein